MDLLDMESMVRTFQQTRASNRKNGIIPQDFRVGELLIRKILLGSPNSGKICKTPPTWVRQDTERPPVDNLWNPA